jgi:phosphomannomutase/phosphoglucomutase
MNSSVFREYDIRGSAHDVAPRHVTMDLTPEFAERLGFAYAELISDRKPAAGRNHLKVSVGEDCRLSSPSLATALISGLRKSGIDVVRLGNCPTPATYFSLFNLDLDGGIMVTASHLAADQNGFKICVGRDAIFGEEIQRLRKKFERVSMLPGLRLGLLTNCEIVPIYLEYLLRNTKALLAKTVVVDCGNGNGSQVVPQLLKRLGANVIELFTEMDGRFPNHVPDPSVAANLVDLIDAVKSNNADFGIGIDGDADRIGLIDENGKIISGDELLIIFSRNVLKSYPACTIVSEVKSSFRLFDDIEKNGGKAIMSRTGHSFVEAKMKETGALLGGEMSGHMFFADRYFGYDDAPYAALRFYEIASRENTSVSALLDGLKHTFVTPEIRLPCEDDEKVDLVQRVKSRLLRESGLKSAKFTVIDGVRIDFDDGWGLLRASNTEAVLSLRFEAMSQSRLEEIKSVFEIALKAEQYKNKI